MFSKVIVNPGKNFAQRHAGQIVEFETGSRPLDAIRIKARVAGYCDCSGECYFIILEVHSAQLNGKDVLHLINNDPSLSRGIPNKPLVIPTDPTKKLIMVEMSKAALQQTLPKDFHTKINKLDILANKKTSDKKELLQLLLEYDKAFSEVETFLTAAEAISFLERFTSLHKGLANEALTGSY